MNKQLSTPFPKDTDTSIMGIDDALINNLVNQLINSVSPDTNDESKSSDTNDYKADTEQLHQSSLQLLPLYDIMDETNHESPLHHSDRQSILVKTHAKPNLFRPDTNTPWDTIDIEDLQDEMTQELQSMVYTGCQSDDSVYGDTNIRGKSFFVNHHTTNTILSLGIERGSNLIQTLSHDWDSEDMRVEGDQMKKHLEHLKIENGDNHL
eukprot:CAMPEP_0201574338 /NCGR_PEP_ID=MMETSP0190_2-20130828/18778_1 /ASSEMBLY_ACC=CAM_ASM_000263 /TAXON_ID=37353 /ORGANISM="Rosalina sp." /LENGTH=207 /DNA_ID=CAMNT_0048002457 /DNA_START=121 /DNA_END=744 /DNA_ORIENTATION=+